MGFAIPDYKSVEVPAPRSAVSFLRGKAFGMSLHELENASLEGFKEPERQKKCLLAVSESDLTLLVERCEGHTCGVL